MVSIHIVMTILACLSQQSAWESESGDRREGASGCSDSKRGDGRQLQKEVHKRCLKLIHQKKNSVRNSISKHGRQSRAEALRVGSSRLWNVG